MSEVDDATIREAMAGGMDEFPDDMPPDDVIADAMADGDAGAGDAGAEDAGVAGEEWAASPPQASPAAAGGAVSGSFAEKEMTALLERQKKELAGQVERIIRQMLAPQPRQPEAGEMPPMPVLPDGLGMNLEQVQNLLAERHKTIAGLDDPLLMMVTILNAFLAQENAMMERHKTAMAKVIADKTGEYVGAVKQVTDSLSKSLSDVTIAAMQKTFFSHVQALTKHQRNIMWLSAIAAISALVNVAVFIWK